MKKPFLLLTIALLGMVSTVNAYETNLVDDYDFYELSGVDESPIGAWGTNWHIPFYQHESGEWIASVGYWTGQSIWQDTDHIIETDTLYTLTVHARTAVSDGDEEVTWDQHEGSWGDGLTLLIEGYNGDHEDIVPEADFLFPEGDNIGVDGETEGWGVYSPYWREFQISFDSSDPDYADFIGDNISVTMRLAGSEREGWGQTHGRVHVDNVSLVKNIQFSSPEDQIGLNFGDDAEFAVDVIENPNPVDYQWFKSDDDRRVTPDTDIELSNETSSTLSLVDLTPEEAGFYYCRITDTVTGDSYYSWAAKPDLPPVITEHPQDQVAAFGDTATFNVTVNPDILETYTVTYQWYSTDDAEPSEDDTAIDGATSPELTVTADGERYYYCKVYVDGSPVDSLTAFLALEPIIIEHPEDQVVSLGGTATFNVTVNPDILQDYTVSYQWYSTDEEELSSDDTPITNATDSEVNVENVDVGDEKFYYCKVTVDGWSVNSATAFLATMREMAHWPLNEDNFDYGWGDHLDISGNDYRIMEYSGGFFVEWVDGVSGESDGAVKIIEDAGWGETLDIFNPSGASGQLSVSLWLNWNGDPDERGQVVLAKRGDDWWETHWEVSLSVDGSLNLVNPDYSIGVPEAVIADGQWQHIAVTFDGETGRIYINGELRAEGDFGLYGFPDVDFTLGNYWAEDDRWFDGAMADVRVYGFPLSYEAVAGMYYDVTGIRACIDPPPAGMDLTGDCEIAFEDLALFLEDWLRSGRYPACLPDDCE